MIDRAAGGSECQRARILAYEPPGRVVFSWDISPHWRIESDPKQISEVEVRFYAETPDSTRLELEHRHIDRQGPEYHAVTDGVDGEERAGRSTWPATRPCSRKAADVPPITTTTEIDRPTAEVLDYETDPTRFSE